jgi:hypothetical protein
MRSALVLAVSIVVVLPAAAGAQSVLRTPRPSPQASVAQAVGVTDISISYSRPAVNKRKIWGELEAWGQVWRAGANENTVIAFSTDVTVEGKKLAAGSYGLHMIPNQGKPWTIIFSTVSTMWGSYGYDAKEDALRVEVAAEEARHQERLLYTFDEVTDKSATVALTWDKVRVPFRIEVDTPGLTVKSLQRELRGVSQFDPRYWSAAAAYTLRADAHLEQGLEWIEKSISMQPQFGNQMVKASFLEKKGDAAGAQALREKVLVKATEPELNTYAYGLLGNGKGEQALQVFKRIVQEHPESWNAYDSLAECQKSAGDKQSAIANYEKALSLATDPKQRARIEGVLSSMKK